VKKVQFIIEQSAQALKPLLPAIQALADSEKEPLGFLPAKAFEDAIARRRLMAAVVQDGEVRKLAGYLLYSGVFPNAKVQQIAAAPAFRKKGAASALMKALIAELERVGFLGIRADVASDLPIALAFYAKHGFEKVRERAGGTARGRMIVIHSRPLETDNLFSLASAQSSQSIDMGARRRNPGETPVFAFDLNVYFDLVRQRAQSENARRLFGEALGHTLRLAVADEFITELRKTSNNVSADPVLQMALQMPRLPKPDVSELNMLAASIHEIVFVKTGHKDAGSENAKADAKHVAHAALSKATAFVTRDGPILNARQELLASFGIDIATVEEVLDLLPLERPGTAAMPLRGDGFEPTSIEANELSTYCIEAGILHAASEEFADAPSNNALVQRNAIQCDGRVVAVGALIIPKSVDPIARLLIHVRQEHQDAELFADYLIETLVRAACGSAAITIELLHFNGQSIVNRLAAACGFHRNENASSFLKVAIGMPLTSNTWPTVVQQVRRRTGLVLPDDFAAVSGAGDISIQLPGGASNKIDATSLENQIGPTIIVWPGRNGVIVPIARRYADDLLGTSDQSNLGFITNRDAAFLSKRGYVNSPRTTKLMRPGSPIIFYESKRDGKGRGAAVAIARIASSVVVAKAQLDAKSDKRLVIDDADQFSATDDVLFTTFDNLMPFQTVVGLKKLKEFNATGSANLVSAVLLSSEQITSILTCGWSSGKAR
jgi:GNAT superfamily N-acetyltransferase